MPYHGPVSFDPPRVAPLWAAIKARLEAGPRTAAVLGGAGRVYKVTDEHEDPEGAEDAAWGRIVLVPVTTPFAGADNPGRDVLVPFLVRIEFNDLDAPGYDVMVSLEAAQEEAFRQLHGWKPTGLNGAVAHGAMYRETAPQALPLWDDRRDLWYTSAEYRVLLAPSERIAPEPVAPSGPLAHDSFDRANTGGASDPVQNGLGVSDSGHAWEQFPDVWEIINNEAKLWNGAAEAQAVIDVGVADVTIKFSSLFQSAEIGFAFSALDSQNFLHIRNIETLSLLYKTVAGTKTELARVNHNLPLGTLQQFELRTYAGLIEMLVDGVVILSHQLSAADYDIFGSRTKHGLYSFTTVSTFIEASINA